MCYSLVSGEEHGERRENVSNTSLYQLFTVSSFVHFSIVLVTATLLGHPAPPLNLCAGHTVCQPGHTQANTQALPHLCPCSCYSLSHCICLHVLDRLIGRGGVNEAAFKAARRRGMVGTEGGWRCGRGAGGAAEGLGHRRRSLNASTSGATSWGRVDRLNTVIRIPKGRSVEIMLRRRPGAMPYTLRSLLYTTWYNLRPI